MKYRYLCSINNIVIQFSKHTVDEKNKHG